MVYEGANGTPAAGLLGEELEEGGISGTGAVLGGCFAFVVCWALLPVCKVEKNRVRISKYDLMVLSVGSSLFQACSKLSGVKEENLQV